MFDKIIDSFACVDAYAVAQFGVTVAIAAIIAVPVTAYILRREDAREETSLSGLDN